VRKGIEHGSHEARDRLRRCGEVVHVSSVAAAPCGRAMGSGDRLGPWKGAACNRGRPRESVARPQRNGLLEKFFILLLVSPIAVIFIAASEALASALASTSCRRHTLSRLLSPRSILFMRQGDVTANVPFCHEDIRYCPPDPGRHSASVSKWPIYRSPGMSTWKRDRSANGHPMREKGEEEDHLGKDKCRYAV